MSKGVLENLYHIAIAVNSIDEAERIYETALGLKVAHREVVEDQKVKTSMLLPGKRRLGDRASRTPEPGFPDLEISRKEGGRDSPHLLSGRRHRARARKA